MNRYVKSVLYLIFLVGIVYAGTQPAPADSNNINVETLDVYLDCDDCDTDFIKLNIPFVNYVREPQTASLLIKIIHQNTGSGGRRYTISFFGHKAYNDINQKLDYISAQTDSHDDDRRGITKTITMGLMPYISQTPLASSFDIEFDQDADVYFEPSDPWNYWTFHIELSGDYEAEKSQNQLSLTGVVKANQTTEDTKVRSRVKYDYENEEIKDNNETVNSILRELETDFKIVKSINEKWSYGANLGINSTTFRNIDFSISFAPAVEYNFYPWPLSDHRVAALSYFIGAQKFNYIETTIFGKKTENVFFEGIGLTFEIIEPRWEVYSYLRASHFFNDFKKNKIELESNISLKIIQGFSIVFDINVERPHDQIYLPQEGATRDEILLKRKKLATDYELALSFGIQYSFGSIYNSIVNRRL